MHIPLIAEPSQGTTQTGAAPSGTGGTPSPSGPISTTPFGYPGPYPGFVDSILRSDGLSNYYTWDGTQWVYSYTG